MSGQRTPRREAGSRVLGQLADNTARQGLIQVNLELTQECNLRCCHCYLEHKTAGRELDTARWRSVLDQIQAMGTLFVGLTGGEILMRDDFFEIAGYAQRLGLFFHLQTNGTLIDALAADAIKALNPTKVEISLYGSDAGMHDRITRVRGSFDRSMFAMGLLKERNIRVVAKTAVLNVNWREVPKIRKLTRSLDIECNADPLIMPGVSGSGHVLDYRMDDDQFRSYMLEQGWDKDPDGQSGAATRTTGGMGQADSDAIGPVRLSEADIHRRLICSAARSRCAVSSQGDVIPCILWRISGGNLADMDLESIWAGRLFTSIREVNVKSLKKCKTCSTIGTCVRCFALAYLQTGDFLGEAPEACRMSRLLKEVRRV